MTQAPAPALTLAEAVPLGYALVLRAASDVGVRALAIKGPVLGAQGLRGTHQSVDIDVLVEPRGVVVLQQELERLGWRFEGSYTTPDIVPTHSVNHSHPRWPCGVDLHHWFPGFLADPDEVFEVVWARRTTVPMAHQHVAATDAVVSAAVAALHYLRGTHNRRPLDDLVDRVARTWDPGQLAELAAVAADTGATDTLRPFLDAVGAPHTPATRSTEKSLADWHLFSDSGTTAVVPWLVGLRHTPWYRRPAYVWSALWLRESNFKSLYSVRTISRADLWRARRARLVRGTRSLPRAWREYRRLQR